jgi:hypothetical protein
MSKLVANYDGGTSDHYGTFLTLNRFLSGNVVEGLNVLANGTPNMTVLVQPGSGRIPTGTYPSSTGYLIGVDTSGGESVAIGTAAASPRIDYIVGYIDLSVTGSTSPTYVNNTNNVLKFADVQGTPAGSPSVPTVSQIQTTIGASNPYIILAQVAVAASTTAISNANITDARVFASATNGLALGASSYVDSGCVWSATSGLAATMTAGLVYINVAGVMVPVNVAAIATNTFTASQDTYVYVNAFGTVTYLPVTNNTTSPTQPANSVLLGIIVSSGSAVTLCHQGNTAISSAVLPPTISNNTLWKFDVNGVPIYPLSGSRLKALQYRVANVSTGSPGGTPVAYNGFLGSYKFNVVAGMTYDFRFHEPNVSPSGTTGIANYTVSFLIGGTVVDSWQKDVTQATLSFGANATVSWTAPTTGSVTLTVQFTTAGAAYSYALNATTTTPASLSVKAVG